MSRLYNVSIKSLGPVNTSRAVSLGLQSPGEGTSRVMLSKTTGALEGGGGGILMSHVEFKKWLCQLSLIFYFSIFHVDFKMVSCRM